LPERELRAARTDADGLNAHMGRIRGSAGADGGRNMEVEQLDVAIARGCSAGGSMRLFQHAGATRVAVLALFLALSAASLSTACAQGYESEKPVGATAQELPGYLAKAGLEQRLGQTLPMAANFTDETGRSGELKSWFDGKPVVMAIVYYRCAMLCPQVLHGLGTGLQQSTLALGKDYDVLVFSIDPMDTTADAAAKKQEFLSTVGKAGDVGAAAAVHFLTGDAAAIQAISGATGFHYVRVPGPDGAMDQFAHSSVIMFATPEGRLSKYLSGIDYPARDLRLALLDASAKKISNPVDLLMLYCCSYNPVVGKYSVSVIRILGIAGMVTLAIVIGMVFLLTRKPKLRTA
jgi:protein SCO1